MQLMTIRFTSTQRSDRPNKCPLDSTKPIQAAPYLPNVPERGAFARPRAPLRPAQNEAGYSDDMAPLGRLGEPEDIAEAAMLAVRSSPACCPQEVTLRLTKPPLG